MNIVVVCDGPKGRGGGIARRTSFDRVEASLSHGSRIIAGRSTTCWPCGASCGQGLPVHRNKNSPAFGPGCVVRSVEPSCRRDRPVHTRMSYDSARPQVRERFKHAVIARGRQCVRPPQPSLHPRLPQCASWRDAPQRRTYSEHLRSCEEARGSFRECLRYVDGGRTR